MKIYLDSCVWIEYIWQVLLSRENKKEQASTKLINYIKNKKEYEIIFSPFLISEISCHFRDWFILPKIMADGFPYSSLRQVKKNYELNSLELIQIEEIIDFILKINNVNFLPEEDMKKKDIEDILNLEVKYSFDFYDAFHVFFAVKNSSDYFVTKDGPVRSYMAKLKKNNPYKIESIHPKKILKIFIDK